MNDCLLIRVSIRGLDGNELRYDYTMGKREYEESLAPLPRDRGIDFRSALRAKEMLSLRERNISLISNIISHALFHACAKGDLINGHDRQFE